MRDYFGKEYSVRFVFPIDGDCINSRDGENIDGGIRIAAEVEAPAGHDVEICGIPAAFSDGIYRARIDVREYETSLRAVDKTDCVECSIKVLRLPNAVGGYRLSSDDNIIFLSDINDHKDEYTSIFDNPYLSVYKKAHDLYGAKVHLNIFYAFDDKSRSNFSSEREYFDLSMMTDKFKEEFRANSDWLKFSFHAQSEFPNMPYKYADGETVRRDAEKVLREIVRFAGPEILSGVTTVHWGEANEDGVRALRQMGYKAMAGYFIPGSAPVAYYAPDELIEYVYNRDFWYDKETDVLFGRIDRVLNLDTNKDNIEMLKSAIASPTRGGFISVMIHEQYFYSDYKKYLPDFAQRVLDACELITKCGYKGRHFSEVDNIGGLYT